MTTRTILDVEGMTCGHCAHAVESALRKIEGVDRVEVRLDAKRAIVDHDAKATLAQMIAAVGDAGYAARG